jgi:hypothetical protein
VNLALQTNRAIRHRIHMKAMSASKSKSKWFMSTSGTENLHCASTPVRVASRSGAHFDCLDYSEHGTPFGKSFAVSKLRRVGW